MMKKLTSLLLILVLVLSLCTVGAMAAGRGSRNDAENAVNGACVKADNCSNFVDSDNDSLCDNLGTRPNFVDVDNDGVCDRMAQNGCPRQGGHHDYGHGCRRGM